MKTLLFKPLLISIVSFSVLTNVFSVNITFQATVKTTENASIPRVYVKIYIPGKSQAVDSMFTNDLGYIERELLFTSVPEIKTRPSIVVRKLSPNIITQKETDCSLEYNYPGKAELFFIDVCGRKYANYSELSTGLYFYYLRFDDGMQSEINRMVVDTKSKINVKLISTTQLQLKTKAFEDADKFYAVFIKDGFVTRQDTILIDNPVISKNYQLVTAVKPTAAFTF